MRTSRLAWSVTARSDDHAPGLELRILRQRALEAVELRVEGGVAAARQLALGEERRQRLRLLRERAQDVEGGHVAGALPDRVERRVAQEARHPGLLHVAVTAEALERLVRVSRGALADPVLHHCRGDAPERRVALVVRARHPHRHRRGGLRLDREVGKHVAHQRLLREQLAEGAPVAGVVHRLGEAPAHPGRRADQAVEPGVVDHPDDGLHAAALLAHEPAAHAVELDLARGQRARAELVLQPLDAEARVAPLDQEAGEARGRLREREEEVARGIGAEPLVAGDLPGVAVRRRAGGVRANVGAALLLGHRHAHERAVVVARPRDARLPLGRQLGLLAQGGNRGVGHRHRAHDPGVHLAPHEEEGGAHCVGARLRVPPGKRVDLALDRLPEAPVPGRVELDLVDAVAVAVVRAQDRLVALGALGVGKRLGGAGQLAGVAQAVHAPATALSLHRLAQCEVRLEHVVRRQRRRLILDVVSGLGDLHLQVAAYLRLGCDP